MRKFQRDVSIAILILAALHPACAMRGRAAETEDAALRSRIEKALAGFRGDVGVYVRHLRTGRSVSIRADELFPTASMIKVPIMAALFDRIERGEIDYRSILTYRESMLYAGEDILGSFKDGEQIRLSKLVMLMITMSDNTASLWCQQLAGTGAAVNKWLEANGFAGTRVNSRTPGREEDWKAYGWGQTTPREMADLLVRIREGKAVSPAASDEMYRALTRIYWNKEALSQIPPTVQAASKQGAVSRSRSEVVLVNAPSGDYVFCIITKNQQDTSWIPKNEGYTLIRNISSLLWQHFEPRSGWKPVGGAERWR